jgi:integrase
LSVTDQSTISRRGDDELECARDHVRDGVERRERGGRRPGFEVRPLSVISGWRALQRAEHGAVGIDNADEWVFTDGDGNPIHPDALYQVFRRIVANADVPKIRFHDLRHTHGSLLIKEGNPMKVVSERLGHAHIAHTIQTYQHLLPGMGSDAARTFERLTGPVRRTANGTGERRGNRRRKSA